MSVVVKSVRLFKIPIMCNRSMTLRWRNWAWRYFNHRENLVPASVLRFFRSCNISSIMQFVILVCIGHIVWKRYWGIFTKTTGLLSITSTTRYHLYCRRRIKLCTSYQYRRTSSLADQIYNTNYKCYEEHGGCAKRTTFSFFHIMDAQNKERLLYK